MKRNVVFPLTAALVVLGAIGTAQALPYTVDASHSSVSFRVAHLGISKVTGQFEKFEGGFDFDPQTKRASAAHATIEVASIDTKDEKRNAHLKSPDFFDAEKFPQITFNSTSISPAKGGQFVVKGDLTIRGVTKPIVLKGSFNGAVADPWGNERASFSATGRINRLDFGVNWNKTLDKGGLLVGNDVELSIEVEGVQVKEKDGAAK